MCKKDRPRKRYPIINFRKLAAITGVGYQRLYNILGHGIYDSMTGNERTHIANAVYPHINTFFNRLGFYIEMKRLSPSEKVPHQDHPETVLQNQENFQ